MKSFIHGLTLTAIIAVCVFGTAEVFRSCAGPAHSVAAPRTDTVWIRDTIRDTVLVPVRRYITRVDTVFVRIAGGTDSVAAEIPIERKVYQTDDYRAEIEGFRPSLVSMEVYRQTQTITNTITIPDRRRWSVGLQAGYGLTPKGLQPYLGIGLQYSIRQW